MNKIEGLTKKIKDEADVVKTMTIEEAKKLPNVLGVLASQMLTHRGWYGYNEVDHNNRKVLIIRA